MVIDGGLANARLPRNGVHAGGIDTALAEQSERGMNDLLVRFKASRTNHGQISIFENR
jgi:hypothetical protein